MKKSILLLLVLFAMLFSMDSCVMRNVKGAPYTVGSPHHKTRRHYGAKKNYKQRREIWGRHHYGHRPYRHRGRYRQ